MAGFVSWDQPFLRDLKRCKAYTNKLFCPYLHSQVSNWDWHWSPWTWGSWKDARRISTNFSVCIFVQLILSVEVDLVLMDMSSFGKDTSLVNQSLVNQDKPSRINFVNWDQPSSCSWGSEKDARRIPTQTFLFVFVKIILSVEIDPVSVFRKGCIPIQTFLFVFLLS